MRARFAVRGVGLVASGVLAMGVMGTPASALMITPNFDSSITTDTNATKIEGAINSAISTIEGLYSNDLSIGVDFTYNKAAAGNLLSTSQSYYSVSYSDYVNKLTSDSASNPSNTVLSSAVGHLLQGNDADGTKNLALSGAQRAMLGLGPASGSNATININSAQNFAFSRPVSGQYDLIGGLEHELDEVLGGGGAGSWLNYIADNCMNGGAFCNLVGALDLYRYSTSGTPSFDTSGAASSYFSVDGGATKIVAFNQNSNGDFGDFAPACGSEGDGQLIQNAFNCKGQDEAYTTSSPEFAMLESIGYNGYAVTPLPASLPLFVSGLGVIGLVARKRRKSKAQAAI